LSQKNRAKVLVIKGYALEDIKRKFSKHPKYKIGIKLHAIYQGISSRKVAEVFGFSFK